MLCGPGDETRGAARHAAVEADPLRGQGNLLVSREIELPGRSALTRSSTTLALLAAEPSFVSLVGAVVPLREAESAFAITADRSRSCKVLLDFPPEQRLATAVAAWQKDPPVGGGRSHDGGTCPGTAHGHQSSTARPGGMTSGVSWWFHSGCGDGVVRRRGVGDHDGHGVRWRRGRGRVVGRRRQWRLERRG